MHYWIVSIVRRVALSSTPVSISAASRSSALPKTRSSASWGRVLTCWSWRMCVYKDAQNERLLAPYGAIPARLMSEQGNVTDQVAAFDELPFNYLKTGSAASVIRERDRVGVSRPRQRLARRDCADRTRRRLWYRLVLQHVCLPLWVPDARYRSVDDGARAGARHQCRAGNRRSRHFFGRDLFELGTETFDIVVSIGVLHHAPPRTCPTARSTCRRSRWNALPRALPRLRPSSVPRIVRALSKTERGGVADD